MSEWGVFSVENLDDLTYKTSGEPLYVAPDPTWSYGKKRNWENHCYGDEPGYWEQADREDEAREEHLRRLEIEESNKKRSRGETEQEPLGGVHEAETKPHAAEVPVERNLLELPDESSAALVQHL